MIGNETSRRVSVSDSAAPVLGRRTASLTCVPALPLMRELTTSIGSPLVARPSTETITSADCNWASAAGDPSITRVMRTSPFFFSRMAPMPE